MHGRTGQRVKVRHGAWRMLTAAATWSCRQAGLALVRRLDEGCAYPLWGGTATGDRRQRSKRRACHPWHKGRWKVSDDRLRAAGDQCPGTPGHKSPPAPWPRPCRAFRRYGDPGSADLGRRGTGAHRTSRRHGSRGQSICGRTNPDAACRWLHRDARAVRCGDVGRRLGHCPFLLSRVGDESFRRVHLHGKRLPVPGGGWRFVQHITARHMAVPVKGRASRCGTAARPFACARSPVASHRGLQQACRANLVWSQKPAGPGGLSMAGLSLPLSRHLRRAIVIPTSGRVVLVQHQHPARSSARAGGVAVDTCLASRPQMGATASSRNRPPSPWRPPSRSTAWPHRWNARGHGWSLAFPRGRRLF